MREWEEGRLRRRQGGATGAGKGGGKEDEERGWVEGAGAGGEGEEVDDNEDKDEDKKKSARGGVVLGKEEAAGAMRGFGEPSGASEETYVLPLRQRVPGWLEEEKTGKGSLVSLPLR